MRNKHYGKILTYHIERQNLNLRMQIERQTRKNISLTLIDTS
ncbi:hypothetical protein GHT40_03105 [Citrobacter werkmanii]|nr:hypothetical protein [Citrobacter werkmanii]